MEVLAIDPGNTQSAYMRYVSGRPYSHGKVDNIVLLNLVLEGNYDVLVLEMIASYGMPVGREVFETCLWIGRYQQAHDGVAELVYRKDVKLHLCSDSRAKDGNIRQALIDRFGPGKEKAIGTKKAQGPLYGISADVWSALALAVTYADKQERRVA